MKNFIIPPGPDLPKQQQKHSRNCECCGGEKIKEPVEDKLAADVVEKVEDKDPRNIERWWKNRRRMAYISLTWSILQTPLWILLIWAKDVPLSGIDSIMGWSYGIPMSIILAYFGNTLAEELVKHKQKW